MNRKPIGLPDGIRWPQKYRRAPKCLPWFIQGARDGVAGRAFGHNGQAAFVRRHGQAALTAYAEGYNEGRAARNVERAA